MTFAADKRCAEFGTDTEKVKLFAEEYSITRSAATGETVLLDGTAAMYNGGAKAVRLKLNGTAHKPCADVLDRLLTSGAAVTLTYAGMTFENLILTDYKCEGKSGCSEKAEVEFMGECAVSPEVSEAPEPAAGGDIQ